jgi:hypothetical protein
MKAPFLVRPLLRLHARAESSPYFDIGRPGDWYMRRNWILGARSPERNDDNPAWTIEGFVPPRSSLAYRLLCRYIAARAQTTLRSDRDRHNHDHPSWSVSVVLAGGCWEVFEPTRFAIAAPLMYRAALDTLAQSWIAPEHAEEHRYMNQFGIYWRGPGAIVVRRATTAHRLVLPRGVVMKTIFIVGKSTNHWGFITPTGKVGWREYLGVPAAAKPLHQVNSNEL